MPKMSSLKSQNCSCTTPLLLRFLQHNKILDLSKLKKLTNDVAYVTRMIGSVSERKLDIVGKEDI